MKLKIQARAKINWTLDVVGTLPNGYHDLDMLMQSVTLCDQMTMEEAPQLSLYVRAQGRAFVPADGAESSALSQARHVEAAGRARAALCDAVTAIEDGMPLDVAAVDLSAALDALGEITGETMSERVIDEVFAKFCVGK